MTERPRSRVPEYLQHMLEAIERIRSYTQTLDEQGFLADLKTQDAVLRNIEILGEAARNVERSDSAFTQQHPGIPWSVIYAMRNRLSHGYFEVDMKIVWKTVRNDLPPLEAAVASLQKNLPDK